MIVPYMLCFLLRFSTCLDGSPAPADVDFPHAGWMPFPGGSPTGNVPAVDWMPWIAGSLERAARELTSLPLGVEG